MFRFVKQISFLQQWCFFSFNVSNVNTLNTVPFNAVPPNAVPLKFVSVRNQECRIRPEIMNINTNEPMFYPYGIKVNKCSGSCNSINDPYSKLCVPDVV